MTTFDELCLAYLREIRDLLKGGLHTTKNFTIETKGDQPFQIHSFDQLDNQGQLKTSPLPPEKKVEYDWWRTRDGNYVKVARVELEGEIYDPTGQKITGEWYNPYSLKAKVNSVYDLENRKSGEAKGWPEWTK